MFTTDATECRQGYYEAKYETTTETISDLNTGSRNGARRRRGCANIRLCFTKSRTWDGYKNLEIHKTGVRVTSCHSGLTRVRADSGNGNMNQGCGANTDDLWLCYESGHRGDTQLTDLALQYDIPEPTCKDPIGTQGGANGDFNQNAGGENVFMCSVSISTR